MPAIIRRIWVAWIGLGVLFLIFAYLAGQTHDPLLALVAVVGLVAVGYILWAISEPAEKVVGGLSSGVAHALRRGRFRVSETAAAVWLLRLLALACVPFPFKSFKPWIPGLATRFR
jgi:hypothetical protein